MYFLALIISCKSGLIWPLNWFVKLDGNSVLIPGIYLGEIKGKNLARLAHFFVVVEYFYQDPLAQENQQPLQYMYHDIIINNITVTTTLHNFVSPTAIDLLKIPH